MIGVGPSRETAADTVRALTRDTSWTRTSAVGIDGDAGHPQGLTRFGEGWLLTTLCSERAELLVLDARGHITKRVDLTDGPRSRPGGLHAGAGECWVAVAENRPRSTTSVVRLDAELQASVAFRFEDHLGAVCPLGDGTLLAVSWASRMLYRLGANGVVLDRRENPSFFVDFQDLTVLSCGAVAATGVGGLTAPHGRLQLGAIALVDPDTLALPHETPVSAWEPGGRVATYNALHLDVVDEAVRMYCVVGDGAGVLAAWDAS